jgi:tetratricopeptide (TPR) repeat protein
VSALVAVLSVWALVEQLTVKTRQMVLFLVAVIALWMTWTLPRQLVLSYNASEKGLVYNLGFQARAIRAADGTNFTAASTTIGVFGYELLGHRVIDMLGLTDSTIARHPEPPIAGLQSTWKEYRHNSAYLLSQSPDYIVFSTGIKPSAPAEKTLFLYKQFVDAYQPLTWFTPDPNGNLTAEVNNAFKKMHPVAGEPKVVYPFAYVDQMIQGISAMGGEERESQEAIKHFDQAIRLFPDTPTAHLLVPKAFSLAQLGRYAEARALLSEVLSRDSLVPAAHQGMFLIEYAAHNQSGVDRERQWMRRLEPWFVDPNERLVRNYLGIGR